MSYYFNKTLNMKFDDAITRITEALQNEGFGILTDIDVRATFKKKLEIDYRNYRILGACNPHFAHRALEVENKIGTMLPCSVVVQEIAPGRTEVAIVDPAASMQAVHNPDLEEIAEEVRNKLLNVIEML